MKAKGDTIRYDKPIGKVITVTDEKGGFKVKIKFNKKVKISKEWKILLGIK